MFLIDFSLQSLCSFLIGLFEPWIWSRYIKPKRR